MELVTQQSLIREEVKRLLSLPFTNQELMDIKVHERYLSYLVKEFFSKDDDIVRLTKLEWLAVGTPSNPIKKEIQQQQNEQTRQNLEIAENYLGFTKELFVGSKRNE